MKKKNFLPLIFFLTRLCWLRYFAHYEYSLRTSFYDQDSGIFPEAAQPALYCAMLAASGMCPREYRSAWSRH